MRTAVILHGLVRECAHAASTFRDAFKDVPRDVFLHTFRIADAAQLLGSNAGDALDTISVPEEELRARFELNDARVEELDAATLAAACHGRADLPPVAQRALCRYESMKRAFELVGSRLDGYDRVVVTRPDVVYLAGANLPDPPEGTVAVPKLLNMEDGKRLLVRMREKNPGAMCEWHHDFFHVAKPEIARMLPEFWGSYLEVVEAWPLPSDPYHPDRALAVYLKHLRHVTFLEFEMPHGLQRDGRVQMFSS